MNLIAYRSSVTPWNGAEGLSGVDGVTSSWDGVGSFVLVLAFEDFDFDDVEVDVGLLCVRVAVRLDSRLGKMDH